jgi:hypothetical protein
MLVGLLIAGGGRRIREAVNSVPAGMLHFGTSENCGNSLFYPVCQRMWIRVADAGFRGLSFPWNSEFQRRLPGELAGCRVWWGIGERRLRRLSEGFGLGWQGHVEFDVAGVCADGSAGFSGVGRHMRCGFVPLLPG